LYERTLARSTPHHVPSPMHWRAAAALRRKVVPSTSSTAGRCRYLTSPAGGSNQSESLTLLKRVLGITDVRMLLVLPIGMVACVAMAYFDAQKELAKESPPFKELPGGRIMLKDGSIVKTQ